MVVLNQKETPFGINQTIELIKMFATNNFYFLT